MADGGYFALALWQTGAPRQKGSLLGDYYVRTTSALALGEPGGPRIFPTQRRETWVSKRLSSNSEMRTRSWILQLPASGIGAFAQR